MTKSQTTASEHAATPTRSRPAWFEVSAFEVAASVLVAFNLAIAYPILDLLGNSAEFFVAHDASRTTVILIALLLTLVVPAILIGAVLLIGRISPKVAAVAYWAGLGLMVAALAMQVLKRTPLDSTIAPQLLIALALLLGYALATLWLLYRRSASTSVLRFSLVVPLLVVVLFGMTDVRSIILPATTGQDAPVSVGNPVPVVMVVFDEFPVASLLDSDLEIDRALFPNFASLANDGTWYRNATSVESHTRFAVPALVTGSAPASDTLPTASDHPDNLFTLLGDSYRVHALEPMTALCPRSVCTVESDPGLWLSARAISKDMAVVLAHLLSPTDWTSRLPAIDQGWANFSETAASDSFSWDGDARFGELVGQYRTWLGNLPDTDSDNVLLFAHSILAHRPWRYLPSGHEYPDVLFAGLGKEGWGNDPWLMAQAYQRHLLQAQAADTMLGELLEELKADGLYDRALIIVTADHGISMQMETDARAPREQTLIDIAAVPLIVRYPGEGGGSVLDTPVETIDILPTIAEVLDVDPRPSVRATSLLSTTRTAPRVMETAVGPLEMPEDIRTDLTELVAAKLELLGDAAESLFELAPPQTAHLLGQPVSDLAVSSRLAPFSAEIINGEAYKQVDFESPFVPALVGVNLDTRLPVDEQVNVAVGVNGEIAATTRTMSRGGDQRPSELSAMIDPDFFVSGENEITLYLIDEGDVLRPIPLVLAGS